MYYLFSFLFIFISFFLYFILFYLFFFMGFLFDFYFFSYGGFDVSLSFIFDFLSVGFFSCVSLISGLVFFYSIFYMEGTVDTRRFLYLVFLFVMSMFFLVFSGNFFLVMVGWDGLGLVSFLLVIFYPNSSSLESGLITVFSNRVGDVFFLLSFFFFYLLGSLFFDSNSFYLFFGFSIFLFFGAITKSAQVPFSAWLPAAMAAPTPVSSLVHSSTLVTAGVYILIRFNYIFTFMNYYMFKFIFLFTMLLAGFCALIEKDFKKVVAMSTLSQLGMMMYILSVGGWVLSFIHMIIHAFFKSMLFLSTGSLMGQVSGMQDSRFYGSLYFSYSSYLYFLVSCMCLAGFPFFIGFYSKDFIISSVSFFEGLFFYYFFLVGCFFTVGYSIRLVYEGFISFFSNFNFMMFKESFFFFLSSMLLFFKCWLLGGLFYWFFLVDMTFFFSFLDLLIGLLIFFFGSFFYFSVKKVFFLFYFFFSISFLRWGFNSGSSWHMSSMFYSFYEGTWMETFGGGGTYMVLSRVNAKTYFFEVIGLGVLIFLSFLTFFLFIY